MHFLPLLQHLFINLSCANGWPFTSPTGSVLLCLFSSAFSLLCFDTLGKFLICYEKKTWTYFIIFFATWRSILQLLLVLPKLFVLPSTSQILTNLKHVFVQRREGLKVLKTSTRAILSKRNTHTRNQISVKSELVIVCYIVLLYSCLGLPLRDCRILQWNPTQQTSLILTGPHWI